MNTSARRILSALVIVVVVLGLGYAWGAAGRGALRSAAEEARERADLSEARAAILEARVSLYINNFGDASRQLERAKESLARLRTGYEEAGEEEAVTAVDTALRHADDAQRLAGKLDGAAQTAAAAALDALKPISR